jgi:hypothetical protein
LNVDLLLSATFLGREKEWSDPATGEIGKPPVAVSFIEYPNGGGELFGVVTRKVGPPKGEAAVSVADGSIMTTW